MSFLDYCKRNQNPFFNSTFQRLPKASNNTVTFFSVLKCYENNIIRILASVFTSTAPISNTYLDNDKIWPTDEKKSYFS